MWERAAIRNTVYYDAKDEFLSTIRHEALYSAYVLSHFPKPSKSFLEVEDLQSLPEKLEWFNTRLSDGVKVGGEIYTYGICLLNKWCGFREVEINELITKKQIQLISGKIYEYHQKDSKTYYDWLHELNKKLLFFISATNFVPTLSLEEMVGLVDETTHELIQKIPSGNPYVAYHINNALNDRCVDGFDPNSNLYQLFKSGSRFSKVQLARSCISIGLLADEKNVVDPNPINTSLVEGLTPEQFFASSPGTRKGRKNPCKKKISLTKTKKYC